nr:tRNA pseudouridine(55) synthase TruB [Bacilli bacterium]
MDGVLIVNKSLGYTSRDVVNIVGKQLNTKKIGHTGTLDPNASGVLVLCVGKALKICELLTDHNKEYLADVILGISTDTLDTDKNATILESTNVNVSDGEITEVVNSFVGSYEQEVPIYSSVKVNGRKLYEYARSNTPVELPKKKVTVNSIKIVGNITRADGKCYFKILCNVGKGTYVRALIRDIGAKLNVPAVMNSLERTRVGDFQIDDSYTLDDIKSNNYKLISIIDALPNI